MPFYLVSFLSPPQSKLNFKYIFSQSAFAFHLQELCCDLLDRSDLDNMTQDQQLSTVMPSGRSSSLTHDYRAIQRPLSSNLGSLVSTLTQSPYKGLSGQFPARAHTFSGAESPLMQEVARGRALARRHTVSATGQDSGSHNVPWTSRFLKNQDWRLGSGFRSMSPAAVDKESRYGMISLSALQDQETQPPRESETPSFYGRKRTSSFDSSSAVGLSGNLPSKVEWHIPFKELFVSAVEAVPGNATQEVHDSSGTLVPSSNGDSDKSLSPRVESNAPQETSDLALSQPPSPTQPIPIPVAVKDRPSFDCFGEQDAKIMDMSPEDFVVVDSGSSYSRLSSPNGDSEINHNVEIVAPIAVRKKLSIGVMIKQSKKKRAYSAMMNILHKEPSALTGAELQLVEASSSQKASSTESQDLVQTVPQDIDPFDEQYALVDDPQIRVEIPKSSTEAMPEDYIPSTLGPNRAHFLHKSRWLSELGKGKRQETSYDRIPLPYPVIRYTLHPSVFEISFFFSC